MSVSLLEIELSSGFSDYSWHTKTIEVPLNMYIKSSVVKNKQVINVDSVIIIDRIEHSISHHFGYSWNELTLVKDWVLTYFKQLLRRHGAMKILT